MKLNCCSSIFNAGAYGNFVSLKKMNRSTIKSLMPSLSRHYDAVRCFFSVHFALFLKLIWFLIDFDLINRVPPRVLGDGAVGRFILSKLIEIKYSISNVMVSSSFLRRRIQRDWYGVNSSLFASQGGRDANENIHHGHNGLYDCTVAGECALHKQANHKRKKIKMLTCLLFPHS